MIYFLMGKSASGKDTIYRELQKRFPDWRTVVLYTTRPIRAGEKNGKEYYFTDPEEIQRLRSLGKVIEERVYQTVYGPWIYATIDDGQISMAGQGRMEELGSEEPGSEELGIEELGIEEPGIEESGRQTNQRSREEQKPPCYLMIGTLESYLKIRDYYGRDQVYPIYIEVPDALRMERAVRREQKQETPKMEELKRRFQADQRDFSEENLLAAGIRKRFVNIDLRQCIQEIVEETRICRS